MTEREQIAAAYDKANAERYVEFDDFLLGWQAARADAFETSFKEKIGFLQELLRKARAEVEFWTPDEANATEHELVHLNRWYAIRYVIDGVAPPLS